MTATPKPRLAATEIAYSGVCMLRRDKWVIAADPTALIMLKRIFPRLDKGELGQVEVKRTEEVDRLLQWFLDLFAMEMSPADLAQLHGGAEAHRDRGRRVRAITAEGYVPETYTMAVEPYGYQRVAADMLVSMRRYLLADEMGVGKTISAITAMSRPEMLPALVVPQAGAMPRQWEKQVLRCLPTAKVFRCIGQTPSVPSVGGKFPDVAICPYHLLQHWGDVLNGRFRMVVFDEVQDLRHRDTAKYGAARALSLAADFTLGMGATPQFNYGAENFAIMDAISPGCMGTWEEFDREHCVQGEELRKKKLKNPEQFGLMLDQSGLRLRRTRKDVGQELPPLTIAPTYCPCNPEELRRIASKAGALAQILTSRTSAFTAKGQAARELDAVFRQATGIGKAPHIAEFLASLLDGGEPSVVCFLHHLAVFDIVVEKLKAIYGAGFSPAIYNGDSAPTERRKLEALRRFTARETPILLMGIRTSNAGLDELQHVCRTVVIGEPDWSPKVHEQGIGRIFRKGQEHPVTAYHLLSEEGSDPVVMEVCGMKHGEQTVVLDPKEERRATVEVDVNRATRLAEMVLAARRR